MALVTYDPDAKALYVSLEEGLSKSKVTKTIPLGEGKYIDVTEGNIPVGLEIILPRSMPEEALDAIVNRSGAKIRVIQ